MNPQLWSWLLMAVGVTGLYLAGKRSWTGWAVGLAAQLLWLAYSITTEQWASSSPASPTAPSTSAT